jgi:hypothetical protein
MMSKIDFEKEINMILSQQKIFEKNGYYHQISKEILDQQC